MCLAVPSTFAGGVIPSVLVVGLMVLVSVSAASWSSSAASVAQSCSASW